LFLFIFLADQRHRLIAQPKILEPNHVEQGLQEVAAGGPLHQLERLQQCHNLIQTTIREVVTAVGRLDHMSEWRLLIA
jgi:hypothetical protein